MFKIKIRSTVETGRTETEDFLFGNAIVLLSLVLETLKKRGTVSAVDVFDAGSDYALFYCVLAVGEANFFVNVVQDILSHRRSATSAAELAWEHVPTFVDDLVDLGVNGFWGKPIAIPTLDRTSRWGIVDDYWENVLDKDVRPPTSTVRRISADYDELRDELENEEREAHEQRDRDEDYIAEVGWRPEMRGTEMWRTRLFELYGPWLPDDGIAAAELRAA